MKITNPVQTIASIHKAVMDIVRFLQGLLAFEIKQVDIDAKASTEIPITVSTTRLQRLSGVVQIASTCPDEIPTITLDNTTSATVTYDFGSGTDGKHTVTFLLIGV